MIAYFQIADSFAKGPHDPRTFVTATHGKMCNDEITCGQVIVGMA